jgi:uncharacterized membrane protein
MHSFFLIAFFAVLVVLTVLAGWTWFQRRGAAVDPAQEQVFRRFVAGIVLFWLVAAAGFFFLRP